MKQLEFFNPPAREFGGGLNQGKRKSTRAISTNLPIHLVLKTRKELNLFTQVNRNDFLIYLARYTKKFNIKLYSWSVQKNHIHLCIRISQRENYQKFIRSLTGILARLWGKGVWQLLPYSRLVNWGKDFQNVLNYIEMNEAEIQGFREYKKRVK